jgi:hypothetical protein
MTEELTKEEVERRAGELARRLMEMPPQQQVWPKKGKAAKPARSGASKPGKSGRVGAGS